MICIIRIKGNVGLNANIKETLNRLRLKRKYSCIVIEPTKENLGMLRKIRDFVAYGTIDKETYSKLKNKRKTKIENFFRLHPL